MMPDGDWREVRGFAGLYWVSDDGRVWGAPRQGSAGGKLAPAKQPNGYWKVCLYDKRRVARWIHRLVLEAFVGPCPDGMIACHRNGNPSDNRLANLRWDTHAANYEDARRHGTAAIGERNGALKLTDEDCKRLRGRRQAGALLRELAVEFGISQTHASAISTGAER